MPRFIRKTHKKAGTPPGTLVHVGEKKQDHTRITLMDYDADRLGGGSAAGYHSGVSPQGPAHDDLDQRGWGA